MIGNTVSHYKILKKLGGGGMGVVYKAEDTRLNRTVALKFLPPSFSFDEEAKKRFINEAQAASSLQHHNICNIHDIDETKDGQIFICMDCYEGETLKKKIERGPLKTEEAIDIIVQVAAGLQKAHEKGIIHRDIKPANIFITNEGVVKILDFGLAKLSGQTLMTKTGSTLGTVAYMSPEQATGKAVDKRTDFWSLGVVLYEMITGKLPFMGEFEQAIIFSILNEEPEPLSQKCKDMPDKLDKIVARLLRKRPDERFQSVSEIISDLESFKIGDQLSKQTRRFKSKHRKLFYLVISAVFLLITLTFTIFFLIGRNASMSSLAVLPFINVENNPEVEYLCDGLAEALTDYVSRLPQLKKVTSYNGVLYFKGKDIPPVEIGKQLGVETLLITRLVKQGDSLKLNIELVDTKENTHLWSGQFKENVNQLNKIPRDVFLSLVENFNLISNLKITKLDEKNPEAYRLYLLGRHYFNVTSIENWRKAMQCYQKAIALDSSFALAYAGLAEMYLQLAPDYWSLNSIRDSALNVVTKALELDNDLPQAYGTLGLLYFLDPNFKKSEQNLLKAIALNPNYSEAYHYYSHLLIARREFDKGISMMRRACELAPFSIFNQGCLGDAYRRAKRWVEAIQIYSNIKSPDTLVVYFTDYIRWEMALDKRDYKQAQEYVKIFKSHFGSSWWFHPWTIDFMLGITNAVSGRTNEALEHLNNIRALTDTIKGWQHDEIDFDVFARIYASLGMKEEALNLIETSFIKRASQLWDINNRYEFDILRENPRYINLLKRGGFID